MKASGSECARAAALRNEGRVEDANRSLFRVASNLKRPWKVLAASGERVRDKQRERAEDVEAMEVGASSEDFDSSLGRQKAE